MPSQVSVAGVAGVALLVVGVILVIASFVPIPVVEVSLLDETFVVGAGQALARCFNEPFPPGTTLHITVEVLSGGDRNINFLVMDEPNWRVFEAGGSPYHYAVPSRRSATEVRVTWNPPSDRQLCFVFDNTFSTTASKTVRAEITMIRYLTLDRLLEAGVLMFVAGATLLVASWYVSTRQKPAEAQH
jgi:hypothetical protein